MGESAGNEYVRFSRSAGTRIAKAVIAVERGSRDQSALAWNPALGVQTGKVFRMATMTSAAWAIDTTATVTIQGFTATAVVTNSFASLGTSSSSARACGIAKDGATWYLIAARCP